MGFSAADVERYAYCPLSWALADGGVDPRSEPLLQGERAHDEKGKTIARWRGVLENHYEALRLSLYLALTAASAMTLAIEAFVLDFTGPYHWILIVMSLTWLFTALAFLLRAMRMEERANDIVQANGLVPGELAYSDLDRPGDTLRSEKYNLSGKPDYIVRRGDHYIPVEVKTGRTPDEPHESHLMQLGVYCLLVEENYGSRPATGVLQYPEKTFEVPFTDDYRDKVLKMTLQMRMAKMTGEVHRNHDRRGKCQGCSRRAMCPERIA